MSERETPAEAARTEAARTAAGTLVNLALIVGVSLALQHRAQLAARARLLAEAARPRRGPHDAGLQVAEFARRVSEHDHGQAGR